MRFQLLPVYSKLAADHDVAREIGLKLPVKLSQHQLQTYSSLRNTHIRIVINTAMTGDGKSLAGQLPLFLHRTPTLALYPTNELIQDQYTNVVRHLGVWEHDPNWNAPQNVQMLYGAVLDQLAEEAEFGKRSDQLLKLIKNAKLILSNPDIFHTIMQFGYQKGIAPDWIVGALAYEYSQLTFDEFHIFDVTQVAAVITGLLFLYTQRGSSLKTLFLSATPGDMLVPLLERAGFKDQIAVISGEYCYDADPDVQEWRSILQPATLHLELQGVEQWLEEHLEDTLLAFFKRHGKSAKGAIIVNSVATAQRLLTRLKEPLRREHALTVEDNTGLTPRSTRRSSYHADILIGTSTVDVGVDFQINFLLFEASSAATFMQRLGRLGRHEEYVAADGTTHAFYEFEAHALVPKFVYERLTVGYKDDAPLLIADQPLQRDTLRQVVECAFPKPARYDLYLPTWGRFQPMRVLNSLRHPTIAETYADIVGPLKQQYQQVFSASMAQAVRDLREYKQQGQGKLLDEAYSFRGGGAFDCGVLLDGHAEPLTYDLVWLLANARVELLTEGEFCADVRRRGYNDTPFKRGYQVTFFRLHSFLAERDNVMVNLDHARGVDWTPLSYDRALVMSGVRLECNEFPELNRLNSQLSRRSFVALLCVGKHPVEVQQAVYLPGQFPLHKFQGNGLTGTIAFGRQALILDTKLHGKPLSDTIDNHIMC